jgi:voltage-gated potassium channel
VTVNAESGATSGHSPSAVRFPTVGATGPITAISLRVGLAVAIVLVNWGLVILERGSYTDSHDGNVSVVDALYYTTVTLTTTGYGDITPVTTGARLVNALVVTPMRLLFVVLLVGTTIKALTIRSRDEFRLARWRSRVKDHIVVLGYGTKGRNAARALALKGHPDEGIVVVDQDPGAVRAATDAGYTALQGSATNHAVLQQAMIARARAVIIALGRDDTAILATLTARRLAPHASVIASAREADNADLLKEGGASSVIVSSETSGRLLGLATDSPDTVAVFEDLLSFGHGVDLDERALAQDEIGLRTTDIAMPVLAVVRGGRTLRYNDQTIGALRAGDRIIFAAAR